MRLSLATRPVTGQLRAEVAACYDDVAERWDRLATRGSALPFQRRSWLSAWYATLGENTEIEPLAVTLSDAATGEDIIALPLQRHRSGRLRIIEFADHGLTDYNAPILGAGAPRDAAGARRVMEALRAALPPADLLRFTKMPREIAGAPNPFALLGNARASTLNGNVLHVPGTWDDWHWGLERTFRKELERSWRVFSRCPQARFDQVKDATEAWRIYEALKRMQSVRARELALTYVLDEPSNESFYDHLVAQGIADGSVVLTVLSTETEIVAALLGITDGEHYAMVRLATAGGEWKKCSPGRLIIERSMKMLHARGYRSFDFTIGDYPYKRRLGVSPLPLVELEAALSWRGLPQVGLGQAKSAARSNPALVRAVHRLRGQNG
jgi:CelD/BcsL family acetyltransferase involved in cellulose biosynthesis